MIIKRTERLLKLEEALLEWRERFLDQRGYDLTLLKEIEDYFGVTRHERGLTTRMPS